MSTQHTAEMSAQLSVGAEPAVLTTQDFGVPTAAVGAIPSTYHLVPDADYDCTQIPAWVPRTGLMGVHYSPDGTQCAVVLNNGMYATHFLLSNKE